MDRKALLSVAGTVQRQYTKEQTAGEKLKELPSAAETALE